ncbi:hypothetical protein [Streptomyces avermitilis]|uniref:hypothetical protein n=1 Tax=Streptomyces avermitilis TaxID=33903 RepID=UPI0033E8C4A5
MVTMEHLRSVADPPDGPPPEGCVTMVLRNDCEAEAVVVYLAGHRSRRAVHVMLCGEDVGYVRRDRVYELFPELSKRLGDAVRGSSPLDPALSAYRWMELRCPEPQCAEAPVLSMHFDEDHPLRCRRHPGQQLRLDP